MEYRKIITFLKNKGGFFYARTLERAAAFTNKIKRQISGSPSVRINFSLFKNNEKVRV